MGGDESKRLSDLSGRNRQKKFSLLWKFRQAKLRGLSWFRMDMEMLSGKQRNSAWVSAPYPDSIP
jgi:hypothetical protein